MVNYNFPAPVFEQEPTFLQEPAAEFNTPAKIIDLNDVEMPEFTEDDFTSYNEASGIEINQTDILTYLDVVFGYSEYSSDDEPRFVAWRSFPEKEEDKKNETKKPVVKFTELKPDYEKDIIVWTNWAAENNYSSYVIPCTTKAQGGKEEDIFETGVIVIDIDNGDITKKLEHLKRYLGTPTLIISSGGYTGKGEKKLHIYYRLSEFTNDLQTVVKIRHEIAYKVGADDSFKRITQPIRVAGSIHQKKEPRLVTIEANNGTEYDIDTLLTTVEEMPVLEGEAADFKDIENQSTFTRSMDNILIDGAHAGADGEYTRYATLSRLFGHQIRLAHDGKISMDDMWNEILSYNATKISPPWPENQIRYNVERLWKEHCEKYGNPREFIEPTKQESFKLFSYKQVYNDPTPRPEDLIAKYLLAPRGFLLLSGPPKAMKSLFLQYMLQNVALGKPILEEFMPAKPLKVLYIQAEISYWALRDRMQARQYTEEELDLLDKNFVISDRFRWKLDGAGIDKLVRECYSIYNAENKPDIICLDPLANIIDGDENDNNEVMAFLRDNLEQLRQALNPEAGLIMVHHSTKSCYEDIAKSPFTAGIRGASCLQGYYSSCIVIARESPRHKERHIWFDFRDGPCPDEMVIIYKDGQFEQYEEMKVTLTTDKKKRDWNPCAIFDTLKEGSISGKYYTSTELVNQLRSLGYPAPDKRLKELALAGEIYFFDGTQIGTPVKSNTYSQSYVWCEGLVNGFEYHDAYNNEGGEVRKYALIYPTHYLRKDGTILDVIPEGTLKLLFANKPTEIEL